MWHRLGCDGLVQPEQLVACFEAVPWVLLPMLPTLKAHHDKQHLRVGFPASSHTPLLTLTIQTYAGGQAPSKKERQ